MTMPCFILVAPQMGENIGTAARVMANFGLSDLRLVAPRDGWPNVAAETMSAGALPDVVRASVFARVEDAITGCGVVIATTARPRGMEKPVLGAREAVESMRAGAARPAVLFGAERSGLPNEAVALSDAILSFPVNAVIRIAEPRPGGSARRACVRGGRCIGAASGFRRRRYSSHARGACRNDGALRRGARSRRLLLS